MMDDSDKSIISTFLFLIMNIEFVSYTGEYPNLCRGILTLKIDGEIKNFGTRLFDTPKDVKIDYPPFWSSGGSVLADEEWNFTVLTDKWELNKYEKFPEELEDCKQQLLDIFNENVPYGCCGGCI